MVDLKAFEKSTVSTLLIPKHLAEKLDLVLPVVLDTATMKKSYNWKAGLKKTFRQIQRFFGFGVFAISRKAETHVSRRGVGVTEVFFSSR